LAGLRLKLVKNDRVYYGFLPVRASKKVPSVTTLNGSRN